MLRALRGSPIWVRRISGTPPKKTAMVRTMNAAFGKYLMATNTISCGVLMFFGDLMEQELEFRQGKLKKRYDYARLTRMMIVGLSMGPVHHYYYMYINNIMPKRDLGTITKKILADQFIMSPVCILQFFYTSGLLEGSSMDACNTEVKEKFWQVYTVDWCVWPPIQFINFYLIPVKYQVVYINVITTLYNVFLSFIKHAEVSAEHK